MSSFNLAKKLQPAKKAWKSFIRSIQSKLYKFKISKTMIKSIKTHCFTALHKSKISISRKLHALRKNPTKRRRYYHLKKSYATIYIDELLSKPRHDIFVVNKSKSEMAKSVEKKQQLVNVASTSSNLKINVNVNGNVDGKLKLPMLPQFRGIDERAEEFISKFREEMKLEREQSIMDFQEMLDRSS